MRVNLNFSKGIFSKGEVWENYTPSRGSYFSSGVVRKEPISVFTAGEFTLEEMLACEGKKERR
ncbi:hypothetical protein RFF05_08035 [Bengtsoniella intestinalis]|uniref:hypothetical protein n=1 Tax=Bengtsoniella intestinalis TaxID=3073143 RepID=UPI00391EF4B6